jgi:hypothetical protein
MNGFPSPDRGEGREGLTKANGTPDWPPARF